MRKKLSKLAKKVLPFLVFPIIASSVYGNEKNITAYFSAPIGGSYHLDRSAKVNENNGILGAGYKLNKGTEIYWKRCINSHGNPTNWIGIDLQTYTSKYVDAGAGAFFVDGYPPKKDYFILGIAGFVKFKYNNFGLKVHIPPSIPLEVVIYTFSYDFKF
jgi:hypothetical protein